MKARFVPRTREQLGSDIWSAKREGVQRLLKRSSGSAGVGVTYAAVPAHQHNIVGVGVGRKHVDGKGTPEYAVRVYVRRKLPPSKLGKYAVPKSIAGIPTDVFETGPFRALADGLSASRKRRRPLCAGASVGFASNGQLVAGTITAVVTRDGQRFVLSNNHVLAFENRMAIGADIVQPGPLDDGQDPGDRIGTLAQFVPLTAFGNALDAAIALLDNPITTTSSFDRRVRLDSTQPLTAKAQMAVGKLGRGSGYTEGHVDDLGVDAQVDFDTGQFSFVNQLLISSTDAAFADVGDSGAMVVSLSGVVSPVAMLFATSPQFALATPIDRVLTALNVQIAG